MVVGFALFSELTKAWQLYLGLIFLFMVMYAPGGIASLIMMNLRVAAHRKLHRLWGWYAMLRATALRDAGRVRGADRDGLSTVQLGRRHGLDLALPRHDARHRSRPRAGSAALAVAALGFAAFEVVRRRFAHELGPVQGEIEATMTFKEPNAAIPEGGEAAAREANRGAP